MSPPLAPPTGGGHCPTQRHVGADEAPLPRAAGSLPMPARPRESGVPQNCETPGSRRGAGTGLVGSSASSAPSPASPGSGGHRPCHCRKRVAGGRTCHWVDPAAEGRSADEEPNPAPRKRDASAEQCGRPGPQHRGAAPLPLTVPPPPPRRDRIPLLPTRPALCGNVTRVMPQTHKGEKEARIESRGKGV